MPKWGRMALYGAVMAVAVDYFMGPALRKTIKP
jgi:hypothetical protein